jgi:hypothetical protein
MSKRNIYVIELSGKLTQVPGLHIVLAESLAQARHHVLNQLVIDARKATHEEVAEAMRSGLAIQTAGELPPALPSG